MARDTFKAKGTPRTIDITPLWVAIMPGLIAVLQDGSKEGKAAATEELMTLAKKVDSLNSK